MDPRIVTVVFCLPGNSFSGRFLECWTTLIAWCLANGTVQLGRTAVRPYNAGKRPDSFLLLPAAKIDSSPSAMVDCK